MENAETVLRELEELEKTDSLELSKVLEDYLQHIAKTGDVVFPWFKAKSLIRRKLEIAITEFHKLCPTENLKPSPNLEPFNFNTQKEKIFEQLDTFSGRAPFTIQRLCELLIAPQRHYRRTDKFMRGIEKNLLVVSTVEAGQRKRSDSAPSTNTLLNGVLDSEDVSRENVTWNADSVSTSYPKQKESERQEPDAADNMSVSDADSGISDTEDEDHSKKERSKRVSESDQMKDIDMNEDTKEADEAEERKELEGMEAEEATEQKTRSEDTDNAIPEDENINIEPEQSSETKQPEDNLENKMLEESEDTKDSEETLKETDMEESTEEIVSKNATEGEINQRNGNDENMPASESPAGSSEIVEDQEALKAVEKKRTSEELELIAEECHAAKQQRISSPSLEEKPAELEGVAAVAGNTTDTIDEKAESTN